MVYCVLRLFGLIGMGRLTLTDVRRYFNPYNYVALAHYNDKPDEQRYPFVVASQNESIPTRSAYGYVVRLALPFIRTIIRIRCFSDITLRDTRMMRERGREGLLPVPSCACGIDIDLDIGAEAAEAVVVEEPKPKP
jgi:hypothetical protein